MGGVVNMVKSVVDTVAPIASMIPGIGLLAMGVKAAVDIGSSLMESMSASDDQDDEDQQTQDKQQQTARAQQQDMGGVDRILGTMADPLNLTGGAAQGIVSGVVGSVGGMLGGIF